MKRRLLIIVGIVLTGGVIVVAGDWFIAHPEGEQPRYVGRDQCVECHRTQLERWTGSDHDLAMDLATPEYVLGNFDNQEFTHFGVTSRFERDGDKFYCTTENADGELERFNVKYVFGVRPLQQYMVEFPDGRVQVLAIAWDTTHKRWFDLHPDERIKPDDELFWTKPSANWNYMCAECHSTDLHKNYDIKTSTYHTTFNEIDVSCEACHGPGSLHIELAKSKSLFWDRRYGYGLAHLKGEANTNEIDTCARCHARRRVVAGDYHPGRSFLDYYQPELLQRPLYHDDGQILDEDYEYGSFLQSRMFRENVRCSDCHDSHSLKLRLEGNNLCLRCHTLAKGNYDSPSHHHHQPGSAGSKCVECHMPTRTYMVVDPRRDHSIRVPRPDLTVKIGTPNACQPCHAKEHETAEWAAAKVVEWYGPRRRENPQFGEAFHAAYTNQPSAEEMLLAVAKAPTTTDKAKQVGGIVRATAIALLSSVGTSSSRSLIEASLKDADPLVRTAAVDAFDTGGLLDEQQQNELKKLLCPLLDDPVRLVRTEAVKVLSRIPQSRLDDAQRERFAQVFEELREGLQATDDDAGPHMVLGMMYFNLGRTDKAVEEYKLAIRQQRNALQAGQSRMQLAAIEHEIGHNAVSEKLYREVIELEPRYAPAHLELGQLLAEDPARMKEAAEQLGKAAKLEPENARIRYNYGLALQHLGRPGDAEVELYKAWQLQPTSTDFLNALTILYAQEQDWKNALACAQQLVQLDPQRFGRLYQQILRQSQQ